MKSVFTQHAQDKLKRADIKKFRISKKMIKGILTFPEYKGITKYGDYTAVSALDEEHDLRVIYTVIDGKTVKVITFHISEKGRYR